jgi:hypothetical protein
MNSYKRVVNRAIAAGLVLLAVLVVPSCDTFPSDAGVGVTLGPGGVVQVRYQPCAAGDARKVTLFLVRGQIWADPDGKSGDPADVILWSISRVAREPSATNITIGEAPTGYRTVVPLSRVLPRSAPLGVQVEAVVNAGVTFTISELRPGEVLNGHQQRLSLAEFEEQACPN